MELGVLRAGRAVGRSAERQEAASGSLSHTPPKHSQMAPLPSHVSQLLSDGGQLRWQREGCRRAPGGRSARGHVGLDRVRIPPQQVPEPRCPVGWVGAGWLSRPVLCRTFNSTAGSTHSKLAATPSQLGWPKTPPDIANCSLGCKIAPG